MHMGSEHISLIGKKSKTVNQKPDRKKDLDGEQTMESWDQTEKQKTDPKKANPDRKENKDALVRASASGFSFLISHAAQDLLRLQVRILTEPGGQNTVWKKEGPDGGVALGGAVVG